MAECARSTNLNGSFGKENVSTATTRERLAQLKLLPNCSWAMMHVNEKLLWVTGERQRRARAFEAKKVDKIDDHWVRQKVFFELMKMEAGATYVESTRIAFV